MNAPSGFMPRAVQPGTSAPANALANAIANPCAARRSQRIGAQALALLILASCATQAPQVSIPSPTAATPSLEAASAGLEVPALAALEARQRLIADTAEQQSAWPQALSALDVLTAIHPEDVAMALRRNRALQSARAAGVEHLRRAKVALQRGENEAATRFFLEALYQDPGLTEASDGLRSLERERVRRALLGAQGRVSVEGRSGVSRNEVEHASLLAGQGDVDAAISVLKPLGAGRSADLTVRRLLADLYFRQGMALLPTNRAGARTALELAVQADPGHARALAQLQQMKASPKAAAAGH
jgi:tetratricopeptide (TPR) repeat protein